ncbi:MAG: ABC transporter ATP-binding protein [Deltaproteobacteria bacterium]|nr:ABC transporter ATP-binding protein [Pseudomonadota bacterium]MCK5187110.1 ABC transporter ATP-binding protein [Deltaproteobacteria bacterium]
MTHFILAEQLNKTYYLDEGVEIPALRGISLGVGEGEFVAIMGASGSGKSTFMNLLGCLDIPTSGRLLLEGMELSSLNANQLAEIRNKKIGFVFQNYNLLPRTSALENVELPLLYSKVTASKRYRLTVEALERVGLKERMHNLSNQLSGGEQQRVAIARALVNNPSLILADEPTGNLDTQTSAEIMQILKDLNNTYEITIILVTHEAVIAQYAKRQILFSDGKIISDQ